MEHPALCDEAEHVRWHRAGLGGCQDDADAHRLTLGDDDVELCELIEQVVGLKFAAQGTNAVDHHDDPCGGRNPRPFFASQPLAIHRVEKTRQPLALV